MTQNDSVKLNDTPAPAAQADGAAHARSDTSFNHVGDTSTNAAWSQMTGGKTGSDHNAVGANQAGGGDGNVGGAIDFAAHGDIYAGGHGQASADAYAGGSSAYSAAGGDSASAGSPYLSGGIDSTGGGHPNGAPGGDSASAGGSSYSAGGIDSAPGSQPYEGGSDAGLGHPNDYSAQPGASSDNSSQFKATEHVPFDSTTANYDGSKFYDLSREDRLNLPESTLNKVNQNNVSNMENRVADLGPNMPDVVFRGAGAQHGPDLESLAQGQTPGDPSARSFAISKLATDDPKQQLSDLAANYNKASGYAQAQGDAGKLYAFDYNGRDPNSNSNGVFQKDHQRFAPEPFAPSTNAGEALLTLDPKQMSHISTLDANTLTNPDRMERVSMSRGQLLDTNQTIQNVDKVLSDIESKNAGYLQGVQAQKEAERNAQATHEAAQSSVFSRMAETVKSWF